MKIRNKIICILVLVLTLVFFFVFYGYNRTREAEDNAQIQQEIKEYNEAKRQQALSDEEKAARAEEVKALIPGIACWGDDTTYGKGGINSSYPSALERYLAENGYTIAVENMGICDEDSLTVLGRASAVCYVINEDTTLLGDGYYNEIRVSSQGGERVQPLLHSSNPGVNPVTVDGVEGMLLGAISNDDISSVRTYYFATDEIGLEKDVKAGTPIITSGSLTKDFINILAIGDNGGWGENPEALVAQQLSFVQTRGKNKDKYLIIGLMEGDNTSNASADELMQKAFGERFLNVRQYLCTDGLSAEGVNADSSDRSRAALGEIPPCFRNESGGFNDKAYELMGRLVFERLEALGDIIK